MSIFAGIDTSNTKENIMKNTIQLIRESPTGQVTIAEVCSAAEITKSTFYYHFHSVDEIVEYFLEFLYQNIQKSLPQILLKETTYEQILTVFLMADESLYEAGPSVSTYRYCNLFKKNEELNFPDTQPSWEIVISLIKKAQANGEILNTNSPEDIARGCFYICRGICTTWAMEGGSFDFRKRVRKQLAAMLLPAKDYKN